MNLEILTHCCIWMKCKTTSDSGCVLVSFSPMISSVPQLTHWKSWKPEKLFFTWLLSWHLPTVPQCFFIPSYVKSKLNIAVRKYCLSPQQQLVSSILDDELIYCRIQVAYMTCVCVRCWEPGGVSEIKRMLEHIRSLRLSSPVQAQVRRISVNVLIPPNISKTICHIRKRGRRDVATSVHLNKISFIFCSRA